MTSSNKNLSVHISRYAYLSSVALFEKVADQPWAMFFDSGVQGHIRDTHEHCAADNTGRYDILAIRPFATLVFDGEVTRFNRGSTRQELHGDPIAILQAAIPVCDTVPDQAYLPGAYGYFSYDLGRQYEELPVLAADDEELPQMAMGIYSVIVVFDHHTQQVSLVRIGDSPEAMALEGEWRDLIGWAEAFSESPNAQDDVPEKGFFGRLRSFALEESLDWDQYQLAFASARQYTLDGDCYQVNLTKRFATQVEGDPWLTYCALRDLSPAPYGSYMNLPFAQVLSNSPESFISCRGRQVVTSPIKGTMPRNHHDAKVDQAVAERLQNSEKDRAENVMIVDLMRNDLSRCCELGSVKVPELFSLHSFSNVHHLISTVTGMLRSNLHSLDLLRSCFPGGSITGAPKIRAMEIIEELEPYRRGLYCGAIGYIGGDGNMETNIAIRTIVVKDGVARYAAGGGLVIDSNVKDEYQELNDKASMMSAAVFNS